MKRLIALLLALVLFLFALPALAEPMSYLDYTDDILEDGSPIYYFPELSLRLPADWRGKVMALRHDGSTAFYQTASYEKYRAEGLDGGGFLFSLGCSVNGSFSQLPAFEYLGFSEESYLNYYLELPTDYPAYNEPAIRAEYDAMHAQIDYVVQNARLYADAAPQDASLALIECPEQGFTTMADPAYAWDYQPGTGISIYTEHAGSIPYAIVYRGEDLIVEAYEYIREQVTPYYQRQYGDDLVAYTEIEAYEIGGRTLPAGLYTYKLQGYLIDLLRLYDSTGDRTVAYTAKYIDGQGEATIAALDTAIRNFKTE